MAIGTPYDMGNYANASTPSSGSITTTHAVATGDLVVIGRYTGATAGVFTSAPTDNSSNTYVQVPAGYRCSSATPVVDVWYSVNSTSMVTSSTISFNFSGSALREGVTAFGVSGMATASPIALGSAGTTNGTTNNNTTAVTQNAVNLYTSQILIIGWFATSSNVSGFTPGGSWTRVGGTLAGSANIVPCYQIVSSIGNTVWQPSWTGTASNRCVAMGFIGSSAKFAVDGGGSLLLGS
jgi:hypothetical protein